MAPLIVPAGEYSVRPISGFTSKLLDTIAISKSKMNEWAEREKAKADKDAESYRKKVEEQQASIDSQVSSLLAIQAQRGLKVDDTAEDANQVENIATQKTALEEQQRELEDEISKLSIEHQTREKRIKGK